MSDDLANGPFRYKLFGLNIASDIEMPQLQ
ncbi:MAG: hypothetical protein JWR39_1087, partial [Devosia sp.]|nr:hypothetical protein [Devosia sp.]